jgi:hypothetical protein
MHAPDRPVWAIFHPAPCQFSSRSTESLLGGRRLTQAVGRHLAARRHPDHLLPGLTSLGKCLLRTIAARVAPIRPPRRPVLECDAVAEAPGNGLALLLARARREMPFRQAPERVPTPLASLAHFGRRVRIAFYRPHPPPARSLVFAPSHPHSGRRPTSAAADRPVWAIFYVSVCHPLVLVHPPLLAGRRLSVAVGPLHYRQCRRQPKLFSWYDML